MAVSSAEKKKLGKCLNTQNRLSRWLLNRAKMLRWHG